VANQEAEAKKIIKMLGNQKTTMLVTIAKDGRLVSRPMTTQEPNFNGVVWFFVSSDADVIDEIEANPNVNIVYAKDENYLSLSGTAAMVDDDNKKKELWYPELKHWFDGVGPESPKVKLIKASIDTARYWNANEGEESGDPKQQGSPFESGVVNY
jgi:general stress protein 26